MTFLLDLMQQHPLLTLAYFWILGGAAMDAFERREGMDRD